MQKHLKKACPNCGAAALYRDTASAGGALVLDSDQEVKPGDSILRCDYCGAVTEAGKPAAAKKAPAKKKAAGAKSSGAKSSARRPQASKRSRRLAGRKG